MTHHGSSPSTDSPTSAAPVSALSAIGSAILPKSVTRPRRRASSPSTRSVIDATAKTTRRDAPASRCRGRRRANSATRKTGTSSSRSTVSALAMFQRRAVARRVGDRVVGGGSASRVGAARPGPPRPRDQVDALASPTTHAAHQVARPRQAVAATSARGAVDLGCLVRGPALGAAVARRPPRPAPRRARRPAPRRAGAISSSASAVTRSTRARDRRPRRACRRTPAASVPSSSE